MWSEFVGKCSEGVLPNITGYATAATGGWGTSGEAGGCLSIGPFSNIQIGSAGTPINKYNLNFSAYNSNNMYGSGWFNGIKVVPASIGMYFVIKY